MNRPPLEVADLVRAAGRAFIERSRKWITWQHLKVLRAIARCRSASLGGHLDECTDCGYRPAISYNSCRNRHCPKCQANARDRWLEARRQELLPTRYVHVVFTLPRELAPLALPPSTYRPLLGETIEVQNNVFHNGSVTRAQHPAPTYGSSFNVVAAFPSCNNRW